jgi:hypothetical protein
MPTKLEYLKAKLEKQLKVVEELKQQVEEEELLDMQKEEFAQKAAGMLDAIAAYTKEVFGELRLPSGKKVTIVQAEDGNFNASMLEPEKSSPGLIPKFKEDELDELELEKMRATVRAEVEQVNPPQDEQDEDNESAVGSLNQD